MKEFHEVANIFPLMTEAEFSSLKADIAENGLREAVWLHPDGSIIDGRNRYNACTELGIVPEFRTWNGDGSLVSFVVSLNLHRRHLTESQRAMVAAKLANMPEGRPNETTGSIDLVSQQEAAEMLSVSVPSVKRAKAVQETGTPELIAAVESGQVSVSAAADVAKLPREEQAEIVAKGEKEILAAANKIRREKKTAKKAKRIEAARVAVESSTVDSSSFDIRHCSMLDLFASGIKPDCIITDPPYPREYIHLYGELAELAVDVPIVAVMCGQSYLPEIMALMTPHLKYRWAIAYLTPGGQAVQQWPSKINTFWKPVLLFGDSVEWIGDVTRSDNNDNDKRFHDWGQSESGMADLIERLTKPGDLICDPFVGGGTTASTSLRLGRRFVGCDIDEDSINLSIARCLEVVNCQK